MTHQAEAIRWDLPLKVVLHRNAAGRFTTTCQNRRGTCTATNDDLFHVMRCRTTRTTNQCLHRGIHLLTSSLTPSAPRRPSPLRRLERKWPKIRSLPGSEQVSGLSDKLASLAFSCFFQRRWWESVCKVSTETFCLRATRSACKDQNRLQSVLRSYARESRCW